MTFSLTQSTIQDGKLHMVECDSCKQCHHQDCLEISDSILTRNAKARNGHALDDIFLFRNTHSFEAYACPKLNDTAYVADV